MSSQNTHLLDGLKVIELGHSVAAPFAGQILGDLGATVLKVESPAGDDARSWGPPFWEGTSATFQSLNRNKSSIEVDLRDPAQRLRLRRLIIEHADVVLQNLRPGLVNKFGLDDSLTQESERLIYCNLGAFGGVGPLSQKPGYDPLMQAFGGIMSVTGEDGRPPIRVGPSIVDMGAGLWSTVGILAALQNRTRTGRGCVVDTSLYEVALSWMTVPSALALASGKDPRRTGSEAAMLVPYRAFQAADKYIVIAVGNDNLFRRFAAAIGCPEWADNPQFQTNAERVRNRELLNGLVAEVIAREPCDLWMERLDRAGVPCAPIQSMMEVMKHPQTEALGMLLDVPDSPMRLMGLPLRFDGERPAVRNAAPSLGADTETVWPTSNPAPAHEPQLRDDQSV